MQEEEVEEAPEETPRALEVRISRLSTTRDRLNETLTDGCA